MTHSPSFTTLAEELRELATEYLEFERRASRSPSAASSLGLVTRWALTEYAREIGIPASEIEGAVDAAITAAGTTP